MHKNAYQEVLDYWLPTHSTFIIPTKYSIVQKAKQ